MAPMTSEKRARMLTETRDEAIALLEDLKHFRDVLGRPQISRGEVRSLCVILRRHLIERVIPIVAAPRIAGHFFFDVPNADKKGKAERHWKLEAVVSAAVPFQRKLRMLPPEPKMPVRVRLDGFLSQPVLFYNGVWAVRKDVIDYVAYVASGVHPSASPNDDIAATLDMLRRQSKVTQAGFQLVMGMSIKSRRNPDFIYSDDEIDVVLLQLLSTIYLIVHSDDTARLETTIRAELS